MADQDYAGQAGYTKRAPEYDASDKLRAQDHMETRRELRACLPAGRALDAQDLAELLDQGNQGARANVLRARILERAAPQYAGLIILSELELDQVIQHCAASKEGAPPSYVPAPPSRMQAPIPSWGE